MSRESAKTALQPNSSLSGVAIGACTCPVHTDSRGSNNNHGVRFNDNTDTGFKDDYRAVAPSDNFHVTPVTPYQPSTDFLQDNIDRQRSVGFFFKRFTANVVFTVKYNSKTELIGVCR